MNKYLRRMLYGALFGTGLGLLALVFGYAPIVMYALFVTLLLYLLGYVGESLIDEYRWEAYDKVEGTAGETHKKTTEEQGDE